MGRHLKTIQKESRISIREEGGSRVHSCWLGELARLLRPFYSSVTLQSDKSVSNAFIENSLL